MKLDYSVKYTDKKGSAIIRGTTHNGQDVFLRRQLPNGKPISWEQYEEGKGMYARWEPFASINIKKLDEDK